MIRKTIGLIAAPFTPFNIDKTLNLQAIGPYARWLSDQGVVGAFICGTTGESSSLTLDERKRLAERWVEMAPGGLRVVVHVGHVCLTDACELAAHAQSVGADSIAALSPYFFKPAGVESLVEWCANVASAAPKLPFYYYHIPSMTGLNLSVSQFLELAATRIPTLAGIKFTHDDLDDLQGCLQVQSGKFDILTGRDEILHSALKLGVQGAVGSTYNFAARLFHAIMDAQNAGDDLRAGELQRVGTSLIDAVAATGGSPLSNFKRFFSHFILNCGPTRLPLTEPTDEQFVALQERIANSELAPWLPSKVTT